MYILKGIHRLHKDRLTNVQAIEATIQYNCSLSSCVVWQEATDRAIMKIKFGTASQELCEQ